MSQTLTKRKCASTSGILPWSTVGVAKEAGVGDPPQEVFAAKRAFVTCCVNRLQSLLASFSLHLFNYFLKFLAFELVP